MKVLFKGGRVYSEGRIAPLDILVDGPRIAALGPHLEAPDAHLERVDDKIVAPGLVDMHVHFREPGREEKETVESGSRAAVRGGFVAVGVMPNTAPPIDTPEGVRYQLERQSLCRILPIACITVAQKGEALTDLAALKAAGAVAFSDDGRCVMNADLMRRALAQAKALDVPMIGHEEDHHLTVGGAANEGEHAARQNIPGMPIAAEDIIVARDILLAEATGGRMHVAHLSSARSVAMIREAKRRGISVTAEVTPHHLLLTDAELSRQDAHYKMNPPLRTERDRQALIEGLADTTIDAIATDHAPHTSAEKTVPFSQAAFGVIGVETALPVLLDRLVRPGLISLERLIDALSTAPARILGTDLGEIAVGRPACLTVLDLDAEETIEPGRFESKSRNTPFEGWTVRGLPVLTMVDGRVVMRGRQVLSLLGAC
ncbi:MAG: dihydroorotase [Armatimonadetes bacterium]|nr:dihydroorotase [Armatimonadota bacterium]